MPLSRQELETALAHLASGDWRAAHEIVQRDEASPFACWLHGITAAEIRAAREELRP